MKLKFEAFVELNAHLVSFFEKHFEPRTWLEFRLLGIDSLTFRIPMTEDIAGDFGVWNCRQGVPSPMARASQMFDVLNRITVDAVIKPNPAKPEGSRLTTKWQKKWCLSSEKIVSTQNFLERISAMQNFIEKHQQKITGTISIFDRIIFKGYLPFGYPDAMEKFLYRDSLLIKDFAPFAKEQSELLKQNAISFAKRQGRPYQYLNEKTRKEAFAQIKRLIVDLQEIFQRTIEPIRPGRKFPRKHKNKQRKYFLQYKLIG